METVTIRVDEMRAIARYKKTYRQYLEGREEDGDAEFAYPARYKMSLDDLYAALLNVRREDPTVYDFCVYWLYPVDMDAKAYGIDPEACANIPEPYRRLPFHEELVLDDVWSSLFDIGKEEYDTRLSELERGVLRKCIETMERFFRNRGKPLGEWELRDWEKIRFCLWFENEENLKKATDSELEHCRIFTDALCAAGDHEAMHRKGYACYGGNRLYPCDWTASRDLMERLFEETKNPLYANTLGYIYYYGRCSDGVPEYDKAMRMFTFAAANGYYEATYKLADMYLHGYQCVPSPETARYLYERVYGECLEEFLKNEDAAFADAALRMGNVYSFGIATLKDPEEAYAYYLEAKLASDRRLKHGDGYGIRSVAAGIAEAIERTERELPKDFFRPFIESGFPYLFGKLIEDNNRIMISAETEDDGSVRLTAERIPLRRGQHVQPVLIVIPRLRYCETTNRVSYRFEGAEVSLPQTPVRCDYFERNWERERLEFYFDDELVGWIGDGVYRMDAVEKPKPSGKQLRFASVAFQIGGKTYDYICEIPEIKEGDTAVVETKNGETEVNVCRLYEQYESELPLPMTRYKKILRKIGSV